MINEKKKKQLEIEKSMIEQNQQNQVQPGSTSPLSKSAGFFTPRKSENHVSSVCLPPPPPQSLSSRHMLSQSIDPKSIKISKWRRFINFFTCCNNSENELMESEYGQNGVSSAKLSNHSKSFKSSIQGDWNGVDPSIGSEGKMSNASQYNLQYRNTSNSNAMLYNILSYCKNGYAQMYFGHYSFFQIPVRFEQHQYTTKKSFSEEFGRLFRGEHILVNQTFIDWEFVGGISKLYSFILCAFSSFMIGIPPPNVTANGGIVSGNIPNLAGSGALQKGTSPSSTQYSSPAQSGHNINQNFTKIPETIFQKPELQNIEFLNCQDLSYTVNFELFDRIFVIPTSLKQQGNSFDVNFNMRLEFRHQLQETILNYIEILHKVVFILPKYCKIKEVMLIIYDTYYKTNIPIYDLNFGLQFHSFSDEYGEVECLVLAFDQQQHLETMAAISQRVFSNINPTIPSLALPSSRKLEESSKQMDMSKSKKLDESSKQMDLSKSKKLEESQKNKLQIKNLDVSSQSNKRSEDDFTVTEDIYSNKDIINGIGNQKPVNEFFEDEYILQLGQIQFKNLYNFLRELNTQFIIQDHVFYYRTHVIDVMLKNNVIQQTFVQTLVNHFVKEDLIKQANAAISPHNMGSGKLDKSFGQKKNKKNEINKKGNNNNKIQAPIDFKDFFQKNSQHFTLTLDETIDKSETIPERIYSPSDYEYQSETTTDQDFLHFGEKNSHPNQNILQIQVHNSLPRSSNQMSHPTEFILPTEPSSNTGSNQVLNNDLEQTAPTRTRIRQKQISCNYFTTGTKNKHIGFKQNKLSQTTLDEDILNRTTASKIFGDKKILKDLDISQPDSKAASKNMINYKFGQEVIPEEIYNPSKSSRNRNFSQE